MYFYKKLCIKYFWKKTAFYSGKHHYTNFVGPYAFTIPIFLFEQNEFIFQSYTACLWLCSYDSNLKYLSFGSKKGILNTIKQKASLLVIRPSQWVEGAQGYILPLRFLKTKYKKQRSFYERTWRFILV